MLSGKTKQVGALPIRTDGDGTRWIMLVTSRETRRLVIPKGWPLRGHQDHIAAVREAREEAGLIGTTHRKSIGYYTYDKRQPSGLVTVKVKVFLMTVERELTTWPEQDQRERAWYSPVEAAAAVDEPELAKLILRYGQAEPYS